jgi:cytochrome c oxidase subunit 4
MSTHTDASHNHTRTYVLTLLALLTLTFITVFAAGIDFGSNMVNVVIALTIATVKATLVALFFMHLLHGKPVDAVILIGSFIFLGLFLTFSYTDVSSRVVYDPISHKPPAGGPAAAAAEAKAAHKPLPMGAEIPPAPAGAPAAEHH